MTHDVISRSDSPQSFRLNRRALLTGGSLAVAAVAWGPGWRGRAQQAGPVKRIAAVDATAQERADADYLCDGVNDYVEGRAALAALPLSGGTLLFSSGHFDFGESNIVFKERPDITCQGAGMDVTFISNDTDLPYDSEPLSYTRCDRAIVRDMTIRGGGSVRTTADALDFDDSDDGLVERVRITGARGRGICFDGKDPGGDSFRNIIRNCIITGCATDGIQLLCTNHCQIINTVCNFNGTSPDNSGYGIRIHHSTSFNQASYDNTVIGGQCIGNKAGGIAVIDGDRNIIDGVYVADNGGDGVRISSSSETTFTTNDSIVRNCTITDTRSVALDKTQRWGVNVNGLPRSDVNNTRILSNNLCGNKLGPLLDNGTGTVVQNNVCGPTSTSTATPAATGSATSTPTATTGTATSTATPIPGSGYFFDNFETGTLQRWTGISNATIQAGSAHGGSFGARIRSTGSAAYLRGSLTQAVSDVWAGTWFKLDSLSGNDVSIMRLRTSSNLSIMGLHVTSALRLDARNDVAKVSRRSTQPVSLGVWHTIEVHVVIAGASGLVETWLDGVRVEALCRTENFGSVAAGMVQIGESSSGRSFTLHVDDVAVRETCVFTCPVGATPTPTATRTATEAPQTQTPTSTPAPRTQTPTNTPVPPTQTPTGTPVPSTQTPTNTPVPPTQTPTNTVVPPTSTPLPHAFGFEILSPVPPPSGGVVEIRMTMLSGQVPVNVNIRSSSANRALESPDWYRFSFVGESIIATLTDQVGPDATAGTTRVQAIVDNVVVSQTGSIQFPADPA